MITFQNYQGAKVVTYQWYGEDHLVVGFSNGVVSLISVEMDSMGQEKANINSGSSSAIEYISVNYDLQKLAVA